MRSVSCWVSNGAERHPCSCSTRNDSTGRQIKISMPQLTACTDRLWALGYPSP